jgi:AcrR family transcriptional regulator
MEGTNKRERKRKLILHCAAILFNTRGTRGTTLTDITTQLGLTKTSLYYYVKNKEDLAFQCYQESCRELALLIDTAAEHRDGSFLPRLFTSYMDVWAEVLQRTRPAIAILSEILALKEPKRSTIVQQYVSLVLRIRDVIERDIEAGVMRDVDSLATAHAFFSSLQWVPAWLRRDKLDSLEALKTDAFDILQHGICNRPSLLSELGLKVAKEKAGALFTRRMSKDEKLEAFLQKATQQFNAKGFNGASIDEISETLNVTKGAFYYHFEDKNALLEMCFRRGIGLGNAAVAFASRNASDGLDQFCFALGFMFMVQNTEEGPFTSFGLLHALDEDVRQRMLMEMETVSNALGSFLEAGKKDGSIRPVNTFVAQSLLTGAILCGDGFAEWREIKDMKEAAQRYIEGLISGAMPQD